MLVLPFLVCVLIVLLCQAGDYWTTMEAFKRGYGEANPLVRWTGVLPAKIGASILWIIVAAWLTWYRQDIRLLLIATTLITVVYTAVILRSLSLIS